LVQATIENKKALKDYVNGLTEAGLTNYEAGFEAAFEVMKETFAKESGTGCTNVI
jgi:hypothetical protein